MKLLHSFSRLPAMLLLAAMAGIAGCETYPHYGDVHVHDRDYDVRVVFGDRDRALIRDYYRSYYKGLPPGLAKQGKVPPGHAKKLYRSQPVPPGLEWRYLPDDLERRLSRLPAAATATVSHGHSAACSGNSPTWPPAATRSSRVRPA